MKTKKGLQMSYPKDWDKFIEAIKKKKIKATTILNIPNGNEKELLENTYRFAARYRLAKSFGGVKLHRFDKETENGYSSILKVFFTYAAFEAFLRIINKKEIDLLNESFTLKQLQKFSDSIIALDKGKNILSSITGKLPFKQKDIGHKNKLDNFLSQKNDYYTNLLIVAKLIRHKFAHGLLTVHLNKSELKSTMKICDLITEKVLFKIMDDQFSKLNF